MTASRKPARKTRKPVSDAVQAERDEARELKIAQMTDQLQATVASLDNEENWIEYLQTIAVFGAKYSAGNQMLIWAEAARRGFQPMFVQSFNAWKAQAAHGEECKGKSLKFCGCDLNVPAGTTGLPIWAPVMRKLSKDECDKIESDTGKRITRDEKGRSLHKQRAGFRIEHVFDVSQLKRPDEVEIPEPIVRRTRVLVKGPRPELLTGEDTTGMLAKVIKLIESHRLTYKLVPPAALNGANGDTNGITVRVRNDVDEAQQIKTAVHELAHNLCGHVQLGYDYVSHRGRAETEAESTAYVVLGALGLDTGAYSAPYVNSWSEGKPEAIRAAAENITQAARTILKALEADESAEEAEDGVDITAELSEAMTNA